MGTIGLNTIYFILLLLSTAQGGEVFEVTTAKLGTKEIQIEVADTDQKRAQGLMHRKVLQPDQGMIFVFGSEQTLSFWMKNTFIPLAIGFFDSKMKLVDIQEMSPQSLIDQNVPSYTSRSPARFALEMNQGWFQKNNVKIGSRLLFTAQKIPTSLAPFRSKPDQR